MMILSDELIFFRGAETTNQIYEAHFLGLCKKINTPKFNIA